MYRLVKINAPVVDDDVIQDVQSMPLMSSSHSCEQEINTRTQTVVKVTCTESHAFRPFAKWNSGATTTVAYKLTYRRLSDTTQRPDGRRNYIL